MTTKARPITLSMGMGPRLPRESFESPRLSPITNSVSFASLRGPKFPVLGTGPR